METVHRGTVDDSGKLQLADSDTFRRVVAQLAGARVELTIRRAKSKRSLRQNAYYWGVVVAMLAEHLGYQQDEMHEALKFKFLRLHEDEVDGLPRVRSSASLSTAEFNTYVENVVTWAGADLGLNIPDPNQVEAA